MKNRKDDQSPPINGSDVSSDAHSDDDLSNLSNNGSHPFQSLRAWADFQNDNDEEYVDPKGHKKDLGRSMMQKETEEDLVQSSDLIQEEGVKEKVGEIDRVTEIYQPPISSCDRM